MTAIDLLTSKVNLLDPQDLSQSEQSDIVFLASSPQWQSFRNYVLRNACIFYKEAGMKDEKESYLLSRMGNYFVSFIESVEKMAPETEQKKQTDAFDDDDIPGSVIPGGHPTDGLPLAPLDE